jgi:uncharacterized membrane protein YphA (DoxX/SURF4 family)
MAMSKTLSITGWVISFLMAALFTTSATMKFIDWKGKEAEFAKSGFTISQMNGIGVLEIVITLIYLIPATSFLGAILLTGYLGGAIVTHLRIGEPYLVQTALGLLVWVGYWFRRPDVIKTAFSKPKRD